MPTRDSAWPNGTPCWVDLGTPDLEAAKSFYADVLGWSYAGGEEEFGGYTTCLTSGLQAAGIGPQMDPSDPTRWTTYFATDDADATASAVTGAGGAVLVPPMQIGAFGRMCVAADPQGHPFGLWEAKEHTGVRIYNEPGALVWNDAAVDDPASAKAFYGAVFGFEFTEIPEMDGYATFARGGDPLGGVGPAWPGMPKGWNTCFMVASTDDAVAVVTGAGGKVTVPAMDSPYGRIAAFTDPWGAPFTVLQKMEGC